MVNFSRNQLIWRIHFWAALLATPFVCVAVLTGLLYVFNPQIEKVLYGQLEYVPIESAYASLDQAVEVAKTQVPPDWGLYAVSPSSLPGESHQVVFVPPKPFGKKDEPRHGGHAMHSQTNNESPQPFLRSLFGFPKDSKIVYVNPYNLQIIGAIEQQKRFSYWAKKLHSTLLQSNAWRWLIEWGATWLWIMLITGVVLAWPQKVSDLRPDKTWSGRVAWKKWHALLGLTFSLLSLTIITTGLTWSQYTGQQIRYLRDAAGQAPPEVPSNFQSAMNSENSPLPVHAVWLAIKSKVGDVRFQLIPPNAKLGVWRAAHVEKADPLKRFDLLMDAYSGDVLFLSTWKDQTLFGQATAIGIPFHRGDLGWWNQAILVLFGFGILFSVISGWMMVFKRYRSGLGLMPQADWGSWRQLPIALIATGLVMLWLTPLMIYGVAIILVIESMTIFLRSRPLG